MHTGTISQGATSPDTTSPDTGSCPKKVTDEESIELALRWMCQAWIALRDGFGENDPRTKSTRALILSLKSDLTGLGGPVEPFLRAILLDCADPQICDGLVEGSAAPDYGMPLAGQRELIVMQPERFALLCRYGLVPPSQGTHFEHLLSHLAEALKTDSTGQIGEAAGFWMARRTPRLHFLIKWSGAKGNIPASVQKFICRAIRDAVSGDPDHASDLLCKMLANCSYQAIAILLAGGELISTREFDNEEARKISALARSNHGRLELARRFGPLEHFVAEWNIPATGSPLRGL